MRLLEINSAIHISNKKIQKIMSVNKVILLGNCGKDPEIRDVQGVKVAQFTLATTDRAYTTKSGTQVPERTEWHNVVAWRGIADVCERYVRKGSKIYIEGKLTTRSWDGRDGTKQYRTEVVIENLELCDKPQQSQQGYQQGYQPQPAPAQPAYQQPQYQQPAPAPLPGAAAPMQQQQQYQQPQQPFQGPGVSDLPY